MPVFGLAGETRRCLEIHNGFFVPVIPGDVVFEMKQTVGVEA